MSDEVKEKDLLTETLPAVRVTKEVKEFFTRMQESQRRRKISEVVRIALEDYVAERTEAA